MTVRIGLIIPSSNSATEDEFRSCSAAPRLRVYVSRVFLESVTKDQEVTMVNEHLPQACRNLRRLDLDATVLACTSGTFVPVSEYASIEDLIRRESNSHTVITAGQAISDQLERVQWKRVGLLTPYPDGIAETVASAMTTATRRVTSIANMGLENLQEIGRMSHRAFASWARAAVAGVEAADFDGLFISCNNLRTGALVQEGIQGLPVRTSNSCTIAAASSVLERT